jgi:uncharacterized membrane protein YkoI
MFCLTAVAALTVLPGSKFSPNNTAEYIGVEKAKTVALEHAKVTEAQVDFTKERLDYDDRRAVYDIEFNSEDTRYDYEIDAVSGEIREFDQKLKKSVSATPVPGGDIGEAEAKAIALDDAGFSEADVSRLKVERDREHGRTVYEVEFNRGRTEYEYEIDAADGTVLQSDVEYDD